MSRNTAPAPCMKKDRIDVLRYEKQVYLKVMQMTGLNVSAVNCLVVLPPLFIILAVLSYLANKLTEN